MQVPAQDPGPSGPFDPPPPSLRRLTQGQYRSSIHDLLGEDILVSGSLEPDAAIAEFFAVGASATSISPRGVAQYETLAYDVAAQAMAPEHRGALIGCTPTGASDEVCARASLVALGRRLWRRPLTGDEVGELVGIATKAGTTLGDFFSGMQFAIAALLQSPNFLFRAELGHADPEAPPTAKRLFDGYELASRLSYFLWNGPPDDELLAAAESGALDGREGISAEVKRMLGSPRARRGIDAFTSDWLQLHGLDDLVKDTLLFTQISPEIGPAAREEAERDVQRMVLDSDGDFRDLFTARETFVNRRLAALYGVHAPSLDGFGLARFPEDQPRRGLQGQIGLLAMNAHPTSTSPTLRGKFVRTILLCGKIPPPPVDVNTGIPEPSAAARTLRQRLGGHANGACLTCHRQMDPIGFAFEHFDGLGVFRTRENGVAIDATGSLDGTAYSDGNGLASALHDHPDLAPCFVRRLYRYASGHEETFGEEAQIGRFAAGFKNGNYRVRALMTAIATSDAFRRAGQDGE